MKIIMVSILFWALSYIPMTLSAKMISYDQFVIDTSQIFCEFTKNENGKVLFYFLFKRPAMDVKINTSVRTGESIYICEDEYTKWEDYVKYSKGVADYFNKGNHIHPPEMLRKLGLKGCKEVMPE